MLLSGGRLFATRRTVAHQVPLSMGISRQEHWNVLPFPPPEDLSHPGMEPASPAQAGRFCTIVLPGDALQFGLIFYSQV